MGSRTIVTVHTGPDATDSVHMLCDLAKDAAKKAAERQDDQVGRSEQAF